MRTVRESRIETTVCQEVERWGLPALKLYRAGWPDRLFAIPGGRPLLVEFKRPGEQPDPRQEHEHAVLRVLGYHVEIHDSVVGALTAITAAVAAAPRSAARDEILDRARGSDPGRRPWSR